MSKITINVQEVVHDGDVAEFNTPELEQYILDGVQQYDVSAVDVSGDDTVDKISVSLILHPSITTITFDVAQRVASAAIKRYSTQVDGVNFEETLSKRNLRIEN